MHKKSRKYVKVHYKFYNIHRKYVNFTSFAKMLLVNQGLAEADAMTQAFHAPMLLVYFLRLLFSKTLPPLPLIMLLRWPEIASTGF